MESVKKIVDEDLGFVVENQGHHPHSKVSFNSEWSLNSSVERKNEWMNEKLLEILKAFLTYMFCEKQMGIKPLMIKFYFLLLVVNKT